MERIAFIIDHVYIYWSDIVLVLAAMAAVSLFLALYGGKGKTAAGFVCILAAVPLSLVLSRLTYWYFRPDAYDSLEKALNPILPGEGALMGAFAACFLTAVFLQFTKLVKNLPELLDAVCVAGSFGIALGRLASVFNASDRGIVITGITKSLWVSAVTNPVSGEVEYRLATFLLQAAAAGVIFLILLLRKQLGSRKNGEITLLFLLLYGASQVVLDSTRYDSLHFRSNGFVSVVQVLCAGAIALTVILYALRLMRSGGWKRRYLLLWLAQAGCFSLAGYMEYYVQRHGNKAVFAYSMMTGALTVLVILTLISGRLAAREKEKTETVIWRK